MATVLLIIVSLGCTPSCEDVCRKLVVCEDLATSRMSVSECEEQCLNQEARYATWDDSAKRDAFEDELSCLYDSSCGDVAEGVCYDEEVFAF
jgi:hypothetical protein